jgi:hypothetical protein
MADPTAAALQIELRLPVPTGKITVSLTDAQGLVLCSQNGAIRQEKAGKIWVGSSAAVPSD